MTALALISPYVVQEPVAGADVTNHFTLPGDGMLLYSNTTGQPVAQQAFLTSGLAPITPAMAGDGFVISLDGSAPNWQFNGARINFYTDATASGHFISSVTAGITQSGDARTIVVTAGAIPGTATHFGTNIKWTQGIPTLIYTPSNVIPADAEVTLATQVMVNSSLNAACLSDFGAPGTSETVTAPPDLLAGEFIVCEQGFSTFVRKPFSAGKHIVTKTAYAPESHDYNNVYQFLPVVEVSDTVPDALTPGSWAAGYSSSGASALTYAVWSDCHPAYKINAMFEGGVHGIVSSLVTSTGHGKTNADRGSIYAIDGVQCMITEVYDANRLMLTWLNTGSPLFWSIATNTITSGTAVHVANGTNTASFVITAGVQAYLFPSTAVSESIAWLEDARELDNNGVFVARLRIQDFVYEIPNAADTLTVLAANVGSTDDFNYNDPSIDRQVGVSFRWIDDAWSTTILHQVTALQDHFCNFSWPTQWQKPNARSSASETLWFQIPGSITCAAAITGIPGDHSNGSPLDFSSPQNITANVKEYYHDDTVWAPASYWSDNVQRPPWVAAYGIKNSGGTWLRKFVMARSRIVGWTADGVPGMSHFLSSQNKAYAVTRWDETVLKDDARTCVAGAGWVDPAFDIQADINFCFAIGGGRYEWHWSSSTDQTDYEIPIRADLIGKTVEIVCQSANCAISINAATQTVTITKIGKGEFTALVY